MRMSSIEKLPPAAEVRRLCEEGLSDRAIARRSKVNALTLRAFRRLNKIPSAREMRQQRLAVSVPPFELVWPPEESHFRWFVGQGFSDRQIGEHYGKRANAVFALRSEMEVPSALPGYASETARIERAMRLKVDPAKIAKLYGDLKYEDVSVETLVWETGSEDFRRDMRSRIVPRNYAALNDPAFRRLVIA